MEAKSHEPSLSEKGLGLDDQVQNMSDVPRAGDMSAIGLGDLGLERAQVRQNLNGFSIIALGFNICNSWNGLGSSLAIGITLGGTITVLYGTIGTTVFYVATALTLAELASVYPTAGGQYHFASILAPVRFNKSLSYACGVVAAFSWISLCSAVAMLIGQFIAAAVILWHPNYVPQAWHLFLLYQAVSLLLLLSNLFVIKRTPWIHDVGFVLTITAFVVITITCVSLSSPKQTNEFVWDTWINDYGWPDGVCFFEGLATPAFMFAGLDAALHLAEECANAERAVPKAVISSVVIGFVTAFPFAVAMLYSISDFEAVLGTITRMPIIEIYFQATRSRAAAFVFTIVHILLGVFCLNAIQQTSSRLTWSLARDNAFKFSHIIGRIHPKLEVPVWALLGNFVVIFCTGCLYLASTTAFNALVGTGIVLQQLSFAFPAALLIFRRRSKTYLPESAPFKLPSIVGWTANVLVVISAILWVIFFQFPVIRPVTASNMNYAIAVTGIMCLLGVINWFAHGRKHYHGPRIHYNRSL